MIFHSQRTTDPAAGSIIMAIGIFLLGAIRQFPIIDVNAGYLLTVITFILWMFLFGSFIKSLFNVHYRQTLANSYVGSFGLGTWIASTSVIGDLIVFRAPHFIPFVLVLAIGNSVLWGFYVGFCIRQFTKLLRERKVVETHGVILLSTVSTQSIAGLLLNVNPDIDPAIIKVLIAIGLLFYGFSFSLLMIRFAKKFGTIHELKNTDCIIHGALSITSLVIAQSGYFSFYAVHLFWMLVFSLFIIIELLEIRRATKRVAVFGWRDGLMTYHITQWSRNFTFGMFYFFTYTFIEKYTGHVLHFQLTIMNIMGWIVFILLVVQLINWAMHGIRQQSS